jgi:hypothetical protein
VPVLFAPAEDFAEITGCAQLVEVKTVKRNEANEVSFTNFRFLSPALADVSLLTLPPSSDSDFSFDWFFTGGQIQSPAEAVTTTALLDMVEAHARIISVSPPISIEESI